MVTGYIYQFSIYLKVGIYLYIYLKKIEDAKGVIRSRNSKKTIILTEVEVFKSLKIQSRN
jgi:hypothetical protein